MKVMSRVSIAAVTIVALSMSSCLLTSRNSLGSREQAKRDERLLGVWYHQVEEPKGMAYVAFLPLDENRLRMIRVSSDERTLEFHGFVSRIGYQSYLNLVCLQPLYGNFGLADPASYVFLHYKINRDNELELSLFTCVRHLFAPRNDETYVRRRLEAVLGSRTPENAWCKTVEYLRSYLLYTCAHCL